MNREEFMRQLENLLSEISEEERKEALEYYRGYFEDAGEENEERILRELESPEKVAQTIKADLGMITVRETEKREDGKQPYQSSQSVQQDDSTRQSSTEDNGVKQNGEEAGKANNRGWKILLIVAAAVITSPIWGTMLGLLISGAMVFVCTLFGFLIAAAAVAGTLSIVGAALFGIGIGQLTVSGAAIGTALMGAGLLVLALAVLAILGCVWLYGRVMPWLIRTIVGLCRRIFFGRRRTV